MKRLLGGLALLGLVAASPPLRDAVAGLDPAVPALLFGAGLALGLLTAWARLRGGRTRRRSLRRAERCAAEAVRGWSWGLVALFFLAPVWSHQSFRPPSRISAFAAQLGHVPWADSSGHFEGANRLLAGGRFGSFSERRPMNAPLLAVRLALAGGDLGRALALQAVLLGLAAWLATKAVSLRLGPGAALVFLALVLGVSRDYLPTASTEPLGITLACLSLAILAWPKAPAHSLSRLGWGLFTLALALGARPGAQLVLPALVAWGVFEHRRRWRLAAAALLAAALVPAGLPWALNALWGMGQGGFTAYPAYTLYGLTRGSNYKQVAEDFADDLPRLGSEGEAARFLYRRALENLRADPLPFLRGLLGNARRFAGKTSQRYALMVSPVTPFLPGHDAADLPASFRRPVRILGSLVLVPAVIGLGILLWRARGTAAARFALAFTGGLLASAPLVVGDAGFRGLSTVGPFLGLGLAAGVAGRVRPARLAAAARPPRTAAALGLTLALVALAGPAPARVLAGRPQGLAVGLGGAGEGSLVASLEDAPAVIVASRFVDVPGRPQITPRDMTWLLEVGAFPASEALEALPRPFALLSGFDQRQGVQRVLVASHQILRERGLLGITVEPLDGAGVVLRAVAWRPLGAAEAPPP
jgi:hypothetical protein